jgi:DNA (cytosine-5)-methyltransferase 1
MFTLQAGKQHAVAFGQNRKSGPVETSHALNGHAGPHGRLDFETETFLVQAVTGDITHALNSANNGKHSSEDGTGRGMPLVAFSCKDHGADAGDISPTLRAMGHDGSHANAGGQVAVQHGMAVRRLMPHECERLQGFNDNHTAITYNKKPAADGPRYKAIGNSMAVTVMRWIGRRINLQLRGTP